jgi:hypothetical protein
MDQATVAGFLTFLFLEPNSSWLLLIDQLPSTYREIVDLILIKNGFYIFNLVERSPTSVRFPISAGIRTQLDSVLSEVIIMIRTHSQNNWNI